MDTSKILEINLRLNDMKQLFNSLDPAPFLERDLDADAADYILDSVKEMPIKRKMRLVISIPPEQFILENIEYTKQGIYNYFKYMLSVNERKLKLKFKQGRNALFLGSSFLIVCLSISEFVVSGYSSFFAKIISEGLSIAGWVSLWQPISTFLYDWWPIAHERKIIEKIVNMSILVKKIK